MFLYFLKMCVGCFYWEAKIPDMNFALIWGAFMEYSSILGQHINSHKWKLNWMEYQIKMQCLAIKHLSHFMAVSFPKIHWFLNSLVPLRSDCRFLPLAEARRASHLTKMRLIACVPGCSSISPPGRHWHGDCLCIHERIIIGLPHPQLALHHSKLAKVSSKFCCKAKKSIPTFPHLLVRYLNPTPTYWWWRFITH